MLWFDVEKKNYTTPFKAEKLSRRLWFDVEKKNYTTSIEARILAKGCGLM